MANNPLYTTQSHTSSPPTNTELYGFDISPTEEDIPIYNLELPSDTEFYGFDISPTEEDIPIYNTETQSNTEFYGFDISQKEEDILIYNTDPPSETEFGGMDLYSSGEFGLTGPTPSVADFVANPQGFATQNVVESGVTVSFTDLSTENPVAWLWEFPGATQAGSNEQNPDIVYYEPGTYDVQLQVSWEIPNAYGGTSYGYDTELKEDYIVVLGVVGPEPPPEEPGDPTPSSPTGATAVVFGFNLSQQTEPDPLTNEANIFGFNLIEKTEPIPLTNEAGIYGFNIGTKPEPPNPPPPAIIIGFNLVTKDYVEPPPPEPSDYKGYRIMRRRYVV
jgi:PKD repeat protein